MSHYWADGKKFSDYHGVAIRYLTNVAAVNRIQSGTFPELECNVKIEWCPEHKCYHILIREVEV
jgi:hypothetical protein